GVNYCIRDFTVGRESPRRGDKLWMQLRSIRAEGGGSCGGRRTFKSGAKDGIGGRTQHAGRDGHSRFFVGRNGEAAIARRTEGVNTSAAKG
ncbi:hypothetical protein ACS22W_25810, partial [Escherichia coli]|uniref:hypothetical protein n=1 Tax=Escherichia coli TaxID=562 RepID=UPI003F235064